ncbi:unnamed protein product [Rotaria sp. Silwood1]|nr:unnamed protein product [Rotaria sp. Silwood1]CAF1092426.1 unnamed protein product [Rotaria sp. Silwood1]CAF1098032.1 unnamed protein product [Rotaria sp. Silwood1]CAF3441548.1 unnamed protein product [Rotaria sp. Silwood1]CAF4815927.1 unnamed protein product [Rotaria sp. Silwood1]
MSRVVPEYYYTSNDIAQEHSNKLKNYSQTISKRRKKRQYNIVEKDFGDHKAYYYVPVDYGNNYDLSQLDEVPTDKEQKRSYSPILVRRKNFETYDDNHIEKLPIISPRQHNYVSPRRAHIIERIYYEPSQSQTSKYIHEHDYIPQNEEINEYVVRDHVPKQRLKVESHPVDNNLQAENLPSISRSPHHVVNSNESSPRAIPSRSHITPLNLSQLSSPRRSILKQHTLRTSRSLHESVNRSLAQNKNQQKHSNLKDVLAQNRARRGSRIPKPRREIDDEEFHDLPIVVPACVCRNHLNEPVDWFIVYKLPRLTHSIDPFVVNGTGYIYLDSSSSLDKWQFSLQSIDSPLSLTGLTLEPLYKLKEYSYIFYNDQPPNMSVSLVYGHSKGVLAFDDNTQKGFWLVHSVPHFPQIIEKGYEYPDSGRIFGQTMLCITLDSTTSLSVNSIDLLSTHFLFTRPLVFDSNLTPSARNRYSILANSIITNKGHINGPPYTHFFPLNTSSFEILTFAKYGLANMDMLSEFIVPSLHTSMLSETWSNGRQMNLPSNCTGQYHTENIEKLAFNFTVHHDHSKWLVSNDGTWTCIGDMNRQAEQKVRHGGFACINDKHIQQRFRQLVLMIEPCPADKH